MLNHTHKIEALPLTSSERLKEKQKPVILSEKVSDIYGQVCVPPSL